MTLCERSHHDPRLGHEQRSVIGASAADADGNLDLVESLGRDELLCRVDTVSRLATGPRSTNKAKADLSLALAETHEARLKVARLDERLVLAEAGTKRSRCDQRTRHMRVIERGSTDRSGNTIGRCGHVKSLHGAVRPRRDERVEQRWYGGVGCHRAHRMGESHAWSPPNATWTA